MDPERRGVIEPIAAEFGIASTELELRWVGLGFLDRATVVGRAAGTRYGSETVGHDSEFRLFGSLRRGLTRSLVIDASTDLYRFRREDLDEFNVDISRSMARLAWSPSPPWLVSGGVRHGWIGFPDRTVLPDTSRVGGDGDVDVEPVAPESEADRQLDLTLALLRRVGSGFVSLDGIWRTTSSNEDRVEYRGPSVRLRGGATIGAASEVGAWVQYSRRTFRVPYAVPAAAEGSWEEREREDEAWQFGFELERPVADRVRFFAEGSWIDQASTLGDFAFDQARFALGVRLDLRAPDPARRRTGGEPAPLAPRRTDRGIRFLYRGARAERVSVVGDFNGWDPDRTPLLRDGEGLWTVIVPLGAGVWRYGFVVDEEWVRPPDAPRYEPDGFGGENGVLHVGPAEAAPPVTGEPGKRPNSNGNGLPTPGESDDLEDP